MIVGAVQRLVEEHETNFLGRELGHEIGVPADDRAIGGRGGDRGVDDVAELAGERAVKGRVGGR